MLRGLEPTDQFGQRHHAGRQFAHNRQLGVERQFAIRGLQAEKAVGGRQAHAGQDRLGEAGWHNVLRPAQEW